MKTKLSTQLALIAVSLLLTSAGFSATTGARGGQPVLATVSHTPASEWGTGSDIVAVFHPSDFLPPDDTFAWSYTFRSGLPPLITLVQTTALQADWWGNPKLPSGALIQRVELQACDTSPTGQIVFGMSGGPSPGGPEVNVTSVASTGDTATPGCAFFSVTPPSSVTAMNGANTYHLFFDFVSAFDTSLQVVALRVYYRLQVSPAPATATFSDVSNSHPFYQYIEALAASGITAGCTAPPNPQYCPDAPLTRGQMAVFLSRAFGLHWAP